MSKITEMYLDYLRNKHPHTARFYLSFLVPDVVYCGTVDAEPADNYHVDVADVSGNIASIIEGHTIIVGTSCGDDSIARRRYKSRVGQVLEIDESSTDFDIGDFITVLDTFELWPKFPYVLLAAPYTFYKDRSEAYTDQNELPSPVAVAGPVKVGFLSGGSLVFALDGTDSYVIAGSGATITAHLWACDGPGGSYSIDDPNASETTITFTQSGQYWLSLTVTDSNGKTHTTRRPIFVHDRSGAYEPTTDFSIEGPITGDWQRGGWSARIRLLDDTTLSDIPEGTFVVLWCEMWYDNIESYFGDSGNILLAGYVGKESVVRERDVGHVVFDVYTISDALKNIFMFSVSLTDVDSPLEWYEYYRLTAARALHHYFSEHSTLLEIADVFLPTSDTTRMVACDDFIEGSLYSQADSFAYQHSIFAHVCCSKMGRVHVDIDISMLSAADRAAITTVMDIGNIDTIHPITVARNPHMRIPLITASGTNYTSGEVSEFISNAPGDVPLVEGDVPTAFERLVVASQTALNSISGRLLAVANAEIVEVRMDFAGNYFPILDLVPQEWFTTNITESKRGITLDMKLVPRVISADINVANGTIFPNAVFEPDIPSVDGITVGISPDNPPVDPPSSIGDPPPPSWPPYIFLETGALIAFDEAEGCWYRPPGATDWTERDAGLPVGAVDNYNQGGWDPWWFTPSKQNTSDPSYAILIGVQDNKIYKSEDCGVTWEDVTPIEDPPNDWADVTAPTVADMTFIQRLDSIHQGGLHIFIARWQEVDSGNSYWRSWFLKTEDDCITWEWVSLCPPTGTTGVGTALAITDNGADVMAAFKAAVGTVPDGSWYTIDENDVILITMDREFDSGSVLWMYCRETPRTLWHGEAYNWDGAGWRLFEGDFGGPWAWQDGLMNETTDEFRLFYAPQALIDDDWQIDAMYWEYGIVYPRAIWADLDTEDGTIIWLTMHDERGEMLYVQRYSVADLSLQSQFSLGHTTKAEVDARTYIAYPMTPLADHDYCVVYGRMNNPRSLGGIQHIINTTNGGALFNSLENGWGADICSALQVGADIAGSRMYTAIRDADAGNPARLYRGNDGVLSFISNLTFGNNVGVLQDALTISSDGDIACGADTAGAIMIILASSPYAAWGDITGSYPNTGVVRSLAYL